MKTLITGLSVALALAVLSGCSSMAPRTQTSGDDVPASAQPLNAMMMPRFDDVPVPNGFKLNPEESFAFQTQTQRVGLLKYTGRVNADRLVAFYKDQMPLYNWNLVNIIEYGRRILNFDRADQTCIVTIESGGKLKKITLIIALAPKATIKSDLP